MPPPSRGRSGGSVATGAEPRMPFNRRLAKDPGLRSAARRSGPGLPRSVSATCTCARPAGLFALARRARMATMVRMASILIVDDDQDGSEAVARVLRKSGHRAVCVPNGREALAMLTGALPDL